MLRTVLVEQQRAVATAGDDDVARTGVLELVRVGHALLGLLDLHAKDSSDLVVVGLNQEGVRLEGLHQELAGRINHELDAATAEATHDLHVHVLGQGVGDGSREDEGVVGSDDVHALEQLVDLLLGDLGSHAVDHGHDDAVELDVDAGVPAVEKNEVERHALLLKTMEQVVTGETCGDAHGDAGDVELVEQGGDVDSVSAAVQLLGGGSVGEAHVERQGVHDVVEGGVQRHRIYQRALLPSGNSHLLSMPHLATYPVTNSQTSRLLPRAGGKRPGATRVTSGPSRLWRALRDSNPRPWD